MKYHHEHIVMQRIFDSCISRAEYTFCFEYIEYPFLINRCVESDNIGDFICVRLRTYRSNE